MNTLQRSVRAFRSLLSRHFRQPFPSSSSLSVSSRSFSSSDNHGDDAVESPTASWNIQNDSESGEQFVTLEGERIVVPKMEYYLDWSVPVPVDLHLFEESPVVKECPNEFNVEFQNRDNNDSVAPANAHH